MTRRTALTVLAIIAVQTIWLTWPQAVHLSTKVAQHHDPGFSIWRMAWIQHALTTDPSRLFDGNIFYPSERTLTFSDATLLEGILSMPFFAAGVSPIAIYNILLMAAIAACGMAMFVLARSVVGLTAPALVAATIFTMAPYRIEHFMHFELQWAMWVPLTFWALHRAVDGGSTRHGLLAGLFIWLQIVSSVYYGVFLAIVVVVFVAAMAAADPRRALAAWPGLLGGAVLSAALTAPYALQYLRSAEALGPRDLIEVANYSARPASYLASPPQNWLWGWTAALWGRPELNLFLGLLAMALAVAAVLYRPRKPVFIYAAIAAVAIEMSLGLNGRLYGWILQSLPGLQGLRSPSRFSIIACAAVAMMAGFGAHAVHQRLGSSRPRWKRAFYPVLLLALAVEYGNTGMILMDLPEPEGSVYQALETAGPGVVAELPMPTAGALAGRDPDYEYWSIAHWHPLLNGYSGYYPQQYINTLGAMETFPDDASIARLRRLSVRYVIVHHAFYKPNELLALLLRIGNRTELHWYGQYDDPVGKAELFLLKP